MGPAAGTWSAAVALLGAGWAGGGPGFPFGVADPRSGEVGSLFGSAQPAPLGAIIVAFGVLGVGVAVAMRRWPLSRALPLVAAAMSAVLLVAVPDARVIQNFLYLFFGYTGLWDGALLAMLFAMAGGVLWAGAAVAGHRRAHSACVDCGRAGPEEGGPSWGRSATYLAAALALPYPLVRICWGLGIPLGVPPEYVQDERLGGLALLGLGAVPLAGAVLTLGLTQSWGERIPHRVPVLGGRRVPVALAVVPAAWAAVLIVQGGVRVLGWTVTGGQGITADNWGAGVPGLFWLPWGLALCAATYAYYLRRRRRCPHCSVPG